MSYPTPPDPLWEDSCSAVPYAVTAAHDNRSLVYRSLLAVVVIVLATLLRLALTRLVGYGPTYITFYPAVILVAILGGFWPGILATVLAVMAAAYWVIPPAGAFLPMSTPDAVGLGVFALIGALMSAVAALYHKARQKAATYGQELARRESERKYRELVQHANSAIIRWKPDGTITFFNEYAQQFFGYREDEVHGKNVNIIVPAMESTGRELISLETIVNHPEQYVNMTNENVRRDGRRVWMTWTNTPVFDENGRVTEILAVGNDITELKQVDEALQQERRILNGIMNSTDVMLVFLDPDFNFVKVNPAYAETCKMRPDEMIGQNHFDLYPDEENEAIFRHVRDTSEPVFYKDKAFEFQDQPERGVTYWDWSLTPVKDSAGTVTGLVFSLRETTQYKLAEEERKQWLEQQQVFVHLVSHDLRTPVTIIQGHADLLALGLEERHIDGRLRSNMEAIRRGIRRMNVMIQDLVDIARVEGGQLMLDCQPIDLATYLPELLEHSAPVLEVARIQVEIPAGLLPVLADAGRLERILTNLLSNALKYSSPGMPVLICARRSDDQVEISVTDQGQGLPPEVIPHLFERFYRVPGERKVEGIGLGLYITKLLVEAHGGRIWVESEVGKWSTITFRLLVA